MRRTLAYLGDAPATPPAATASAPTSASTPSATSSLSQFATMVLWGGLIGGIALAVVGGMMGQHRLLTQHVFKNRRRRARRHS